MWSHDRRTPCYRQGWRHTIGRLLDIAEDRQKGRKGCGRDGVWHLADSTLHVFGQCVSKGRLLFSTAPPARAIWLCVGMGRAVRRAVAGELGAVRDKKNSCLACAVHACLPTRSHCRHANCHQPVRLSRIACANSHARLLGQPAVAAHPFQTRLARIACGGRGLAPTQRHSHRARAIKDSNRRGPSLSTATLGRGLSRPAILCCSTVFAPRAIPSGRFLALQFLLRLLLHPPTLQEQALLAITLPLPAGRRSIYQELTLDTATHYPKLPSSRALKLRAVVPT